MIEELKSYIVEFKENDAMKSKIYPSDSKVGGNDWWPITVIIHDEYIFSANNGIQRV